MKPPSRLSIPNLRFAAAYCAVLLLIHCAPTLAQTLKAMPETATVPVGQPQGSVTIIWDASPAAKYAKLYH